MGQYRVISSPCPTCGMPNDGATSVIGEDSAPREGDTTICIGCGEILVFNAIGATEKIRKEILESFSEEQKRDILRIQNMVRRK